MLLNEVLEVAEREGFISAFIEAPESKPLTEMLYPAMRQLLRKLSAQEKARHMAIKGLQALRGFASAFKITLGDVEIGVDADPGSRTAETWKSIWARCSKRSDARPDQPRKAG
ncbi:hypothetical protein ACFSZS_24055 [Seohaeicola zhoushanensis]